MKYNLKKRVFRFAILIAFMSGLYTSVSAQIVGGRTNSESSPKKVEASKLSGGDFVGDVNLLNGSYNATIPLGTVSTPGGVGYALSLEYSSAFSIGGTKPMCSGIPYGDGWDLNLPTISVESDVFHKFLVGQECDENEGGVNHNTINYDEGEYSANDEGDLYWFSPMINIPGVASGRAVFKYVDVADAGALVFVLNKFESPVEIRCYGDAWKIILADGTQYIFDTHLSNYRAPSNKRILFYDQQVDGDYPTEYPAFNTFNNDEYANKDAIRNVIEAKEAYSVWYCSNISNRNTPLQGVNFNYKGFGNFNYFEEFQQEGYANVSNRVLESTHFPYRPNFETFTDILLMSVSSYVMESPVDILELDYKILNDAINNSLAHNGGLININDINNPEIGILDEMYSFKTVYSTEGNNYFNDWKGYKHWKATPTFDDTYNSNPYLNNNNYYNRNFYDNGLSEIPFNHSFLESRRIDTSQIFPGDIYQIKTKVHRDNYGSLIKGNGTIDIAIVTGNCDNTATSHTNTFSSFDGGSSAYYNSSLYEKTRGIEIFSTFNMAMKWQMGYNKANLETSNFFVMPNIPNSYGGFYIQIGPGNSDLDYARDPHDNANIDGGLVYGTTPGSMHIEANRAYPFYPAQGAEVRKIKSGAEIGHNFGIGLPWGMMAPIFNSIALGSGTLLGSAADKSELYKMWWYNEQLGVDPFENIPTKFGEETSLQEVELIRYSKNPYMLQAVRLYHFDGEMNEQEQSGKNLVAQKRLEYKIENELVLENYDYDLPGQANPPLVYNWNRSRTIILLEKITEVPLNGIGDIYSTNYGVSDPTTVLTTKLEYTAFVDQYPTSTATVINYDPTKSFKGHQEFLLTQFIDHLGGITQVTYYDATSPLTRAWNRFNRSNYCDGYVYPPYGRERVSSIHPAVHFVDKNDENNYLIPSVYPDPVNPDLLKRWTYEYQNEIFGRKYYLVPSDHFRNFNAVNNDFIGYKNVTVYTPKLLTVVGEQNRTEYEYNGSTDYSSSTIEDYLFSGKMKTVKTYSNDNILHDEKIINYGYTLAFKNGYERPNFMRNRLVLDGYLLGSNYEYEDIYKNDVLKVEFPLNSEQFFYGPEAYSYILPRYLKGDFKNHETPKLLEFFFYDDLKIMPQNPEYMFHSYFIKKTDEINRVYENSFSKAGITRPVYLPIEHIRNPFGIGHVNPTPYVASRDNSLKNSITNGVQGIIEKLKSASMSDDVLLHLIASSNFTATQKYEVLSTQKGLSNDIWIQVINIQNQFTPDALKHLINIQPYFSDEILQQEINIATAETDDKIYEAFLLKNEYLSDPIRIELTKTTHILPGEAFMNILEKQQEMSADVLRSIVNSPKLNDFNLVSILKNQYLSDDLFLKIVKDERFTQRSIPGLFMETVAYPTDKVLLEVLNKGSQYSDLSYQHIFEACPRELGTDVQEKINHLFSCALAEILKPLAGGNPLGKYCTNPIITGRKYMETKTSYEYYEANEMGEAVGRAYNVLMDVPEGTRNIDGDIIVSLVDFDGVEDFTTDKLILKHEPSWQVFSVKVSSPHLPGGFSKEEYFYLYDLQNRYDRHWFNYDYSDPSQNFEAEYVSVGSGSTQLSDIYVHNSIFQPEYRGESGEAPTLPPFDGMVKSRAHGMRNLAFQKTTFSKNQHDANPLARSEYYFYDSRWKFDDFTSIQSNPLEGEACADPVINPCTTDMNLQTCAECYTAKYITWEYLISQLPFDYCIWTTNSMENGQNYWFCPSYTDAHAYDSTAVLAYCSGFDIVLGESSEIIPAPNAISMFNHEPVTRALKWDDALESTLQLRSVTIQVDEIPVSNETDPFMTHRMSTNNKYVAEFRLTAPSEVELANGYTNSYSMLFPYKTLTVRKILERSRYLLPELEENQVGLKTRYDYDLAESYWNFNPLCNDPNSPFYSTYRSVINTNIGLPTKITVGDGRSDALGIHYEYTPIGLVKKMTDPSGKKTEYTYDNKNRLLTVTESNADGTEVRLLTSYNYKTWGGNNALNFLDRTKQNYVQSSIFNSSSAGDQEIQKAFVDPLGRNQSVVSAYTDGVGILHQSHSAHVEYDNWGRVNKTFKNYSYTGNVIDATNTTTLDYMLSKYEDNPKGRMIRQSNYGVTDISINQTVKSSYLITNNVFTSCELSLSKPELELIMGTGTTTNYQFMRSEVTDQDGKQNITYVNAIGQQVANLRYTEGGAKVVTLFGYDSYGNLTKVINPEKQVTSFEYNMLGQLVKEKSVDAGTKRYMYNKQGLISVSQDEAGRTNKAADNTLRPFYRVFKYDDYGRLLSVGRTEVTNSYPFTQVYDALYYETKFIGSAIDEPLETGPEPLYFDYKFTTASTQDWLASYTIGTTLTENGVSSVPIELKSNFNNSFAIADLEKATVYGTNSALNSIGKVIATHSYNAVGKKIQSTALEYNDFNQVALQTVQFNETELIPANSATTIVSKIYYPTYNYRGSLVEEKADVNGDGVIDLQYLNAYDKLNRLSSISVALGEVVSPSNATRLVSYTYDDATGKLMSKKHHIDGNLPEAPLLNYLANEISYSYDQRERLTRIQSEMGSHDKVMDYRLYYDGNDPSALAQSGNAVDFTSNFNGNINGALMKYKLSGVSISNPYTQLEDFTEELVYGYRYDKLNRLTKADATVANFLDEADVSTYKIGDEAYSYDKIGNLKTLLRTLKNDDPTPGAPLTKTDHFLYQYTNGNNRLQKIQGQNGTANRNYTYDANGNLVSDDFRHIASTVYSRASYAYEILIDNDGVNENISYIYDVNDLRIYKKVVSQSETKKEYYLQDAMGRSIAILDMMNTNWSYFVLGGERENRITPTLVQSPGNNAVNTDKRVQFEQATYYVYDHLGNTRITYTPMKLKLLDASTVIVVNRIENVVDYFPYGKVVREFNNGTEEKYLTTQHERDGETGLDYRGARYYDCDIARFLSTDPWQAKYPAWSTYNYCIGNPIMLIDPDGKEPTGNIYVYNVYYDKDGNKHSKKSHTIVDKNMTGNMNRVQYWDGNGNITKTVAYSSDRQLNYAPNDVVSQKDAMYHQPFEGGSEGFGTHVQHTKQDFAVASGTIGVISAPFSLAAAGGTSLVAGTLITLGAINDGDDMFTDGQGNSGLQQLFPEYSSTISNIKGGTSLVTALTGGFSIYNGDANSNLIEGVGVILDGISVGQSINSVISDQSVETTIKEKDNTNVILPLSPLKGN